MGNARNSDASADVLFLALWMKSRGGAKGAACNWRNATIKKVRAPANSAISVLDGKIIAETTDTVKVTSNTAASADVIVSALEQT